MNESSQISDSGSVMFDPSEKVSHLNDRHGRVTQTIPFVHLAVFEKFGI
jgi:hypothetical protein